MEEVRTAFTEKHGLNIHIVYAGSSTLLATMKRSNKGDVFVPGSLHTMEKAGEMILRHQPVALHTPVVAIAATNPKNLGSFADLARAGIKVGIAHRKMAALGRTSEEIITSSPWGEEVMTNVIIKAQTVTVLLEHLVNNELDAAILWSDMLLWPEAHGVTSFAIPPGLNRVRKIHAGLLRQSEKPRQASLFVDFMAQEGVAIFHRHGFGAIP
jgi:molybdate transport system substrate-binding protein